MGPATVRLRQAWLEEQFHLSVGEGLGINELDRDELVPADEPVLC